MIELLDYAHAHADDTMETLRRMVEMESFTTDKPSIDKLSSYIKSRLEALNAKVKWCPKRKPAITYLLSGVRGMSKYSSFATWTRSGPPGPSKKCPFTSKTAWSPGRGSWT